MPSIGTIRKSGRDSRLRGFFTVGLGLFKGNKDAAGHLPRKTWPGPSQAVCRETVRSKQEYAQSEFELL